MFCVKTKLGSDNGYRRLRTAFHVSLETWNVVSVERRELKTVTDTEYLQRNVACQPATVTDTVYPQNAHFACKHEPGHIGV